jgi:glycosyltransferase involved in cell wall biosynthesis
MKYLLSILVPTFNRDKFLDRLLAELSWQIKESGASEIVEVIIADNASSDATASVINSYLSENTNFSCIWHSSNLGAEHNLISLLERATSKYLWFIGDDDLPVEGLIKHIISHLPVRSPSLLYLPSVWAPDIASIHLAQPDKCLFVEYSPSQVAQRLHIWTTFISSWIFSADKVFSSPSVLQQIVSLKGSNLPQLGWILPLLVQPQSSILVAKQPCILATAGNTGGYTILKTFLINYPAIVNSYVCHSPHIRRALIGKAVRSYLPNLVYSVRVVNAYRDPGDSAGVVFKSIRLLWSYPGFWLLCLPTLLLHRGFLLRIQLLIKSIKIAMRRLASR